MAVDIGAEAIDRGTYITSHWTIIAKTNPAAEAGTITSIEIWARTDITGLRVGTFYTTNGNTLKCRDSEAIAGTITAGSKVTKPVSLAVEIGDYIGCYYTGGTLEVDEYGYPGKWHVANEYIDPGDEAEYTYFDDEISLGGYFPVPGWTGKISGVTNPAKIMGIDVADIAKVKGVEST